MSNISNTEKFYKKVIDELLHKLRNSGELSIDEEEYLKKAKININ